MYKNLFCIIYVTAKPEVLSVLQSQTCTSSITITHSDANHYASNFLNINALADPTLTTQQAALRNICRDHNVLQSYYDKATESTLNYPSNYDYEESMGAIIFEISDDFVQQMNDYGLSMSGLQVSVSNNAALDSAISSMQVDFVEVSDPDVEAELVVSESALAVEQSAIDAEVRADIRALYSSLGFTASHNAGEQIV